MGVVLRVFVECRQGCHSWAFSGVRTRGVVSRVFWAVVYSTVCCLTGFELQRPLALTFLGAGALA
jgi:hypothetical protein